MVILNLAIYLILNFLALKYNMHIFQLNYYMPDTQIKWTIKNKNKFLIIIILNIIAIISMITLKEIAYIITAIMLLINIILVIEKKVKKKINFTGRIIRMYIINYIILLAIRNNIKK